MANPFYTASGIPITGSPGASAGPRGEFALIQAAFDKMPSVFTANAAVIVNAGGTGLTLTVGGLALAGNLTTTGAFNTTLAQGASVTLTLPLVSGTLATLAGAETFSNKVAIGVGGVAAANKPIDLILTVNAAQSVRIVNSNVGAAAAAVFELGNGTAVGGLRMTGSGWTPTAMEPINCVSIVNNNVGGISIFTQVAAAPVRFGINTVEYARATALGIQVGPAPGRALLQGNYNDALGAAGTLDIDTGAGGASWAGTISVCHANAANASNRTQGTYAIEGRGTNFSTATILNTVNGTGAAFTISVPSNGVIRLTNTSGATTFASMSFTGTQGA